MRCVISVALAATFFSLNLSAKEPADFVAEDMKAQMPDVADWTKISDGFYRGIADDGTIVRLYTGVGGAKLLHSKNQDEMAKLAPSLDVEASSKDAAPNSKILDRLAQVEAENEIFLAVINESESAKESKTLQSISDYAEACGYFGYMNTEFYATASGASYTSLRARAIWPPFPDWTTGPPPPAPYLVRRAASAQANIDTDATGWVDDMPQTVIADAAYPNGAGTCTMWTRHTLSFKCTSTSQLQLAGVERENTCAGVAANTPPIIDPL